MPRIRRSKLPRRLVDHLALRATQRSIPLEELLRFAEWLDTEPIAPEGKWFKKFGGFTVCGEGELVKTFLVGGQLPVGTEMQ